MKPQGTTPRQLDRAIDRASNILLDEAGRTAKEVGFEWVPVVDAPNTFEELQSAWRHSVETGEPYPVSSTNLDDYFYAPEVAHALRFYHDAWHAKTGYTFDIFDEVKLNALHMKWFGEHVARPDTTEYKLIHADFFGQALCMTVTRTFTSSQTAFIFDAVQHGLDQAIVNEVERLGLGGRAAAA